MPIKQIQNYLKENKLDAFLVLTKINRQYLSGFTGSFGAFLVSKNDAALFTDDRYILRAKKETKYPVKNFETMREYTRIKKLKKIGIEDRITIREFNGLKKRIIASWKITSSLVENVRAVKTRQEIAAIAKGSGIIDQAFVDIKKYIHKHIHSTEAEIAYRIEQCGKNLGAEGLAFDPIVAYGPNAAAPHHFSSNTKIGKNNFLLLDYGFKLNGYHSDFTRTLFLGKPNSHQIKVYETVLAAQVRALDKIRLQEKAANIDLAARNMISSKGFGKYFTHNTGHGVGLEIHELPNFSPKSEDILKQNMVVTVEPGIYLPKKFGVRIEDMVLVERAPKIFSKIPKDFKSMMV